MGDLIYSNYRFLNKKRNDLEVAKNQDELDEMVKYFESGIGEQPMNSCWTHKTRNLNYKY
jgi:hypothetical protein